EPRAGPARATTAPTASTAGTTWSSTPTTWRTAGCPSSRCCRWPGMEKAGPWWTPRRCSDARPAATGRPKAACRSRGGTVLPSWVQDLLDQARGQLHHVVLVVARVRTHPGIARRWRVQAVGAVVAHVVGIGQVAPRQVLAARPSTLGTCKVALVFALGLASVLEVLAFGLAAVLVVIALGVAVVPGHLAAVLAGIVCLGEARHGHYQCADEQQVFHRRSPDGVVRP